VDFRYRHELNLRNSFCWSKPP